jgi:hypothetical protein
MTETTAIVCPHVYFDYRPINLVIHHRDGVWQLVCEQTDHTIDCSDFEVVGLEHLFSRQENLFTVKDILPAFLAE